MINFITFKILAEEIKEENLFEKTKFTGEMMNFFYGSQFYENAAAERYIGNREGSVEIQKDENRMKARLQHFMFNFLSTKNLLRMKIKKKFRSFF